MSSRPSRGAARLAAILDALPDALLLVNANGTVVNANSIALDVFEAPGTALIGRGLLDLLPAFDSKRIPGSMRRPDERIEQRQPPTRMVARRTDGSEFPVEVTSANLEDGRTTYESPFEAAYADHGGYGGNELLMLVVRDLTGTMDTEAELARQQRQTEMILRAAAEGVVGTDTEGRVVLVNPAAAQILGYRASDLGGQKLHPLVHHTRGDGTPLPYEETPLADTLRSGRKHRVRGQVLWSKSGARVPVDMTTAPVRDGDQLVGAVLTFTDRRTADALEARHAQLLSVVDEALRGPLEELRGELAGLAADPAGQLWPEANQILHHLSAGYARMTTLIDNVVRYQRLDSGREKLDRKQVSLDAVIAAGVESAVELIGPGRAQFAVHAPPIQAEVDPERLALALAHLVADVAGVDVTGHQAVGGLSDSTIVVAAAKRGGGRGEEATGDAVVRIEVRGPHSGGNPVHLPIARGVVTMHGGVLQTHEVPGAAGGSAYVLEVPVGTVSEEPVPPEATPATSRGTNSGRPQLGAAPGAGPGTAGANDASGTPLGNETTVMPTPEQPRRGTPEAHALPPGGQGDQEPRVSGELALPPGQSEHGEPRPGALGRPANSGQVGHGELVPGPRTDGDAASSTPSGRRARRALRPVEERGTDAAEQGAGQPHSAPPGDVSGAPQSGSETGTSGTGASAYGGGDGQIPQQVQPGTGRRGRRAKPKGEETPAAQPAGQLAGQRSAFALPPADADRTDAPSAGQQPAVHGELAPEEYGVPPRQDRPTGRRRKPGPPSDEGVGAPQQIGERDHVAGPESAPGQGPALELGPGAQLGGVPERAEEEVRAATPGDGEQLPQAEDMDPRAAGHTVVARSPILGGAVPPTAEQPRPKPLPMPGANPASDHSGAVSVRTLGQGRPYAAQVQAHADAQAQAQAQAQADAQAQAREEAATHPGRPGQQPDAGGQFGAGGQPELPPDVPAGPQPSGQFPVPQHTPPGGTGRRRKLATPPDQDEHEAATPGPGQVPQPPHGPQQSQRQTGQYDLAAPMPPGARVQPQSGPQDTPQPSQPAAPDQEPPGAQPVPAGQQGSGGTAMPAGQTARQLGTMGGHRAAARQFTVAAPDAEAAEGPEPLDGPGGAVEVADPAMTMPLRPIDVDDELPPEPLDNPRRLLVWPEPDVTTQQALTDRGYRPVLVHSREEVDAQIAAYPAALFVDPLTGPITRTALQSLRQAAVSAEVPVLVTAGLGQTTREAAYGADPAVLLKALAPRDSEQHPPRVLLVEGEDVIAQSFAATLERRGMQVAHAPSDGEAAAVAAQIRPNLVVMDLAQIRRRRAGVIDWLRVNGLLNRTPFVVYTSAGMDQSQLAGLAAGETVLFLAERSTSPDVQSRLVDLLAKIGAH